MMWLVAWTGGYDETQYAVRQYLGDAQAVKKSWEKDLDVADLSDDDISIYEIDTENFTIQRRADV